MLTKVMSFIGCNRVNEYNYEIKKINSIKNICQPPDLICDVSTFFNSTPLFEFVAKNTSINAATVPLYLTAYKTNSFSSTKIFHDIEYCINTGIKLLTLHLTPDVELLRLSKDRLVPITSRGGNIISKYCLTNSKLGNMYSDILEDIVFLTKENDVTISIGSTFRAANIFDSMDKVNILEIEKQLSIAQKIKSMGGKVIIEGPGHILLNNINYYANKINKFDINIMPLGPIISECNFGTDHIIAAIGAVQLGLKVNIEYIAAISKREHAGGIPSIKDSIEAIMSAKTAAYIINSNKNNIFNGDQDIVNQRINNTSCITSGKCARCGKLCPLTSYKGV